jgi:hypothetical protein
LAALITRATRNRPSVCSLVLEFTDAATPRSRPWRWIAAVASLVAAAVAFVGEPNMQLLGGALQCPAGHDREHLGDGGGPVPDRRPIRHAVVTVLSTEGDLAGHYRIPVPPTGRYILTVVDPHTQWVRSRQVPIIAAQSNTIDIDVESDDLSVAARQVLPGVGL